MPSLKQTILREPTRSYQSLYQDGQARPTSPSNYAGSYRSSSSIRSSGSYHSYADSTQGPAWVNGQWEWSNFGGRKGLTGGAQSLHTPSVVGKSIGASSSSRAPLRSSTMSLRSERARGGDDAGSVRSDRSNGRDSLRSTMSLPTGPRDHHRRTRSSSSREIQQAVEAIGRPTPRATTTRQSANPASQLSSRRTHDNLPSISSSFDQQTSRRYASAPLSTSTSTSSPAPSRPPSVSPVASSSSRPSRSKSPLRQPSDENAPSLTSSASSAPSSGPATPVHSHPNLASPLAVDAAKSHPRKPYASPETVLASTNKPATAEPRQPSPVARPVEETPAVTNEGDGAPRRFYSVDEFFAIAGASNEGDPSVTESQDPVKADAEPRVRSRTESDNVSFKTADGTVEPGPTTALVREKPSVPRLKLTRTESDQSRAGIKGAVDLSSSDDEDHPEGSAEGRPALGSVVETSREQELDEADEEDEEHEVPKPYRSAPVNRAVTTDAEEPAPREVEVVEEDRDAGAAAPRRSASTPAASSLASDDRSEAPSHSSSMTSISQVDSATLPSVDVPDWLQRIRALGEPIETQQPRIAPSQKKKLTPPPHWTVLQLRAQEQKSQNRPPNMNRPRSVGSLRSRKGALYGLPDVAEEEEPPVPSFPAWLPKKAQDGGLAAPRALSPSPNGSLSRASSLTSNASASSTHRRSRSMDLAPTGLAAALSTSTSLQRTASLTQAPAGSRASSRPSSVHSTDTTGSRKLRGLSKLLQPPLASSRAVRDEPEPEPEPEPMSASLPPSRRTEPVYTPSSRYYSSPAPSPVRTSSSLREALAQRDGASRLSARQGDDEDGTSSYGGSQISMMSAPQLSPVRPPRNPARRSSLSMSTTSAAAAAAFDNSPTRAVVNDPRSSPSYYSPASRPPSRPASISGGEQRRSPVPPPPGPIFPPLRSESQQEPTLLPSSSSRANSVSSAARASSRPLSSYLAPTLELELSALAISPRLDVAKKTSRRFSLFRSSTTAATSSSTAGRGGRRRFDPTLDLLYERVDGAAHRKRLRSDQVVVETIAVGLDRWDVEKVWSNADSPSGAGWIPGRAVYGKVVARGEGVSRVKNGDLVWGLTTLKKSSTLAGVVTLDRDHVSLAPVIREGHAVEQLAGLPADAVTAMQIMETYARELPKGSKILILNAHEGIGYLCLQLAKYLRPSSSSSAGRDLWIVAQIPMSVIDGDSLCRGAGATDVVRDEPLAAINSLHEGSFDVVIDTIGGRRLYDASRRILHNSGSFVTTVGDAFAGREDPSSSSTSGFRSLRRAFFKKDKKSVQYWLASDEVDERDAVRDVLDKVRDAVEAGALHARVDRVYSFADARLAFGISGGGREDQQPQRDARADRGAIVVRVKELA